MLALTPAQEYYGTAIVDGRDPAEQWRAKKQSKAEKKAARKAKLDPANQKSALDIMKEREKKRKRELGMDSGDDAEEGASELPAEVHKKAKTEHNGESIKAKQQQEVAGKRRQKKELAKTKKEKQKAKKDGKQAKKEDHAEAELEDADQEDGEDEADHVNEDIDKIDIAGMIDGDQDGEEQDDDDDVSTAPSTPAIESPSFDISANHSTTSSSSSIPPPSVTEEKPAQADPADADQASRPSLSIQLPRPASTTSLLRSAELSSKTSSPKPQLPKVDQAILQERLRVRIEELRAKRKADGPDGRPARSRQELLDQRRKKADQKKALKKELRRKAKEEEARKQEEQLRGSGSPLSGADIFSPRTEANNFSFSRMAFADGSATDASMSKLMDAPKQKGPQDAKTALLAAQNKDKRLSGLDAQKRADIDEKDTWLNAKKRAQGERVRDDTSLLKKALKRKEKQKSKSEKEWQDREQAVVKGKEMKQKRREDNLAKRKEEKGGGKKKPVKKGKKGRPGFEGRFKA